MSRVDRAIEKYADLVAPIGYRVIRHDAELLLHEDIGQGYKRLKNNRGQPCDKSRGWHGLKGACERLKKGGDTESAGKRSRQNLAAKIKKERSAGKGGGASGYTIPKTGRSMVNAFDAEFDFRIEATEDMTSASAISVRGLEKPPTSIDDLRGSVTDRILKRTEGKSLAVFFSADDDEAAMAEIDLAMKSLGAAPMSDKDEFGIPVNAHFMMVDNGKLRPPSDQERKEILTAKGRWMMHKRAVEEISKIDGEVAANRLSGGQSISGKGAARAKAAIEEHRLTTDTLWAAEDMTFDRKPSKPNRTKLEKAIKKEAKDWAKSQGFSGGGVNGFSADATAAHDVAHPATHRLIGLDSKQINQAFGSLKAPDGKPSLLAEEALVNAIEHLSRGDSKEASIQNGLRLARVLSRSGTEEERTYARSEEFARGIIDLIDNRAYKNNEYSNIMPIVRDANLTSGTVTASGTNFTSTATGG